MSVFSTFQLWQALSIAQPGFANSTVTIEADAEIHLDYCIPVNWAKKRTDTTGVQSDIDIHPDNGPAGAFVEIQLTIDRSDAAYVENFLTQLITWYGTQNTNSTFKRGFLGLDNTDNPELDLTPTAALGYKLVQFNQINPIDFHGRQIYRILLQLGGSANSLPT